MITRKSRRFLLNKWIKLISLLFFIILLILLFSFLLEYWQSRAYLNKPIKPDKDIVSSLVESDLGLISIDKLDQIVSRPLFVSTRRPIQYNDTEKTSIDLNIEEKKDDSKQITEKLSSIIIVDGKKTAFLEGNNSTIKLEEGMSYNGWTVIKIDPDQIEVSDGENSETLTLRTFAISLPVEPKKLGNK